MLVVDAQTERNVRPSSTEDAREIHTGADPLRIIRGIDLAKESILLIVALDEAVVEVIAAGAEPRQLGQRYVRGEGLVIRLVVVCAQIGLGIAGLE